MYNKNKHILGVFLYILYTVYNNLKSMIWDLKLYNFNLNTIYSEFLENLEAMKEFEKTDLPDEHFFNISKNLEEMFNQMERARISSLLRL